MTDNRTTEGKVRHPKFGDRMRGAYASENNPQRDGYFVREIIRTGRLNPGKCYQFTDGKGAFWTYPAESVNFVAEEAATATDSAYLRKLARDVFSDHHSQRATYQRLCGIAERLEQPHEPPGEYQQVAALVCARIDLSLEVAKMPNTTAVEVMEDLKAFKDKVIADPESRQRCYDANCAIYSLAVRQPGTKDGQHG